MEDGPVKKVEDTYRDQSRWNDAYGRSNLAVIDDAPERFIIDPAKLPRQQLDLVAALPNIEKKEILEFGSGRGEFSVALAKLGGVVTGIDIGEDLTKLATRVAAVNGVECRFIVGCIDKLPFGDGSFDYVVGKAILHHLPRMGVVDAVREACRVLRPGGMALFVEPIENSKLFDLLQNLFPVGQSGTPQYRPSMLQRARWGLTWKKLTIARFPRGSSLMRRAPSGRSSSGTTDYWSASGGSFPVRDSGSC